MPWQNNGGSGGGGPWQGGGGRNPWGGGPPRGGQRPPDFDDLIRRGQQRLRRLLPGGVGGGTGIMLILLVLLVLWALSGFFRVNTDEEGIILRFGRYDRSVGAGLHYHLPAPIETVITPSVTTINQTYIGFRPGPDNRPELRGYESENNMLTGDENIIVIAFTVQWRIKSGEAHKFLFNIERPQEVTIKAVAESAMREVIGNTPIQEALTFGRNQIEQAVQSLVQQILDEYEAGVSITEVKLTEVAPPAEVNDAFRDVQNAEADRVREINQAEAYRNDIVPRARGQASQMVVGAEAYKQQVIAKAQGDASRFAQVYEQYRQAKDVTRKRIYLETMEDILKGMNKIIIDEQAGKGVVPYLPLDQLQARSGRGERP
ncbi:MAG: FtsH protease activity modulator HflK [Pseudomonadota bacterium]